MVAVCSSIRPRSPPAAALGAGQIHNLVRRLARVEQPFALGFERVGRTHAHTLPAKHAGGLGHEFVEEGADAGFVAALVEAQGERVLGIVGADLHTPPAQDALVVVAHVHGVVVVHRMLTPVRARETLRVGAVIGQVPLDVGRLR